MGAIILAILFWLPAAIIVGATHFIAVKVIVIVAIAYTYMRWTRRDATVEAALVTGIAWALLSIAAEVVVSSWSRGGWYQLLGSPRGLVWRDVLLLAWIGAPALFARRRAC